MSCSFQEVTSPVGLCVLCNLGNSAQMRQPLRISETRNAMAYSNWNLICRPVRKMAFDSLKWSACRPTTRVGFVNPVVTGLNFEAYQVINLSQDFCFSCALDISSVRNLWAYGRLSLCYRWEDVEVVLMLKGEGCAKCSFVIDRSMRFAQVRESQAAMKTESIIGLTLRPRIPNWSL